MNCTNKQTCNKAIELLKTTRWSLGRIAAAAGCSLKVVSFLNLGRHPHNRSPIQRPGSTIHCFKRKTYADLSNFSWNAEEKRAKFLEIARKLEAECAPPC